MYYKKTAQTSEAKAQYFGHLQSIIKSDTKYLSKILEIVNVRSY